jgi:hypothetical protein
MTVVTREWAVSGNDPVSALPQPTGSRRTR